MGIRHSTHSTVVHDYESFKSSDWKNNDKAGPVVAAALEDNLHEAEHIRDVVGWRGVDKQTGQVPYGHATLRLSDIPAERLDLAGIKKVESVNNGVPKTTWKLISGRLVQVG